MHSTLVKSAALLLAAALPMASAQTYTDCNPLDKTCPADPGMGASVNTDFTAGASNDWSVAAGSISYSSQGAAFTVAKEGDAPTIQTKDYFFFGTAEVKMQAAPGTGIVSSIVLESDDLDEIDWEALGGDTTQIETNYFGKGNTATYNRATYVSVSSPQTISHTYTVNWQRDSIQWLVDGNVVRTLEASAAGDYFPQTPMRLRIGIWAGGDPANAPGTIEWAGGTTDYSKGPFTMYVQSVNIQNANPGSTYTYGDTSGSADSIKIDGASAPDATSSSPAATSAAPTSAPASSATGTVSSASHSSAGADTTTSPTRTTSTGKTSTFSTIASNNPSAVINPISGITSSNSTLPGNNTASASSSSGSSSGSGTTSTPSASSSTTAPLHTGGAVSSISASGSLVALYGFLVAIVAYVL